MIKKHKWTLLAGSIVILLPILAGLLLWNRLPEQIPTHWGPTGEVDGWSSKGFAVIGLPLCWHCIGSAFWQPIWIPKTRTKIKKP